METLKFLMVTTHYPPMNLGGDAFMVENLAHQLRQRGHEVHIFTNPMVYRMVRRGHQPTSGESRNDGGFVHEFLTKTPYWSVASSHVLGLSGKAEQKLGELTSSIEPDVVHWHNTRAFIGTPVETRNALNVYTAHDYNLVCPKGSLLRHDATPCEKPNLCQFCLMRSRKSPQVWRAGASRRVTRPFAGMKTLAPSEFMAHRLGSDGIRVSAVIRTFVPDPGPISSRSEQRRDLVYLGILEPHKGPDTLLDAFSMSRDLHGFSLVMIGRGSLEGRLRERIQNEKLSERVQIKGFIAREEIVGLLSESAAMVIPSEWYENAPAAAIEGLAMGVPLIASDIGGLPEIVKGVEGSVCFEPGDAGSLAERLVASWDDLDKLHVKSKAARRAYESRHTPETHIEDYYRVLSDGSRHFGGKA